MADDLWTDPSDGHQIPIGPLHIVRLFRQHQRPALLLLIGRYLSGFRRIFLADQLAHRLREGQVFLPHDKINGSALDTVIRPRPLEKAVVLREDIQTAAVLHVDGLAACLFRLIAISTGKRENVHTVCLLYLVLGEFMIRGGASSHKITAFLTVYYSSSSQSSS